MRNLWTGATSTSAGGISASVPSHGAVMYRVTRTGSLAAAPGSGTHQIGDISWLFSSNAWGPVERNQSNGEQAGNDGVVPSVGGFSHV